MTDAGATGGPWLARPGSGMALLLAPMPAWAYIDPGVGSVMLQLIFGGLAAAAAALGLYWRQLLDGLRRLFRKAARPPADGPTSPDKPSDAS